MLRPTLITLLLCLAGSVWSEEGAFETEGGNIRGPRINEQKSSSDCKQEKNWPICSDEDWGPKCPSGCRIQGLTDKTDKDFGKRIDNIKKKLKDGEVNYKTVDVITKETYEYVKDNFIQAQESDGKYNQVSEDLRKKIEILKLKVSSQIERIKLLQTNIRDQVVEIKRLEVDIDIKIRACKGSCAKYVSYQVDKDSYDNIQKQLLQAESTNMRPETNTISVLKMRPIKDSAVDTIYKSLPQKGQEAQYPVFTDINQYAFVLERKGQEVTKPSLGSSIVYSGKELPSQGSKTIVYGGDKGVQTGGDKTTVTTESRVVSCTKTIKKKIIHGPDGPREEVVETVSGGEECEKLGKGVLVTDDTYNVHISSSSGLKDTSSLPNFEDFFASSSGGKTQFSQSGSSKGTVSKTTYATLEPFSDLGESEFDDFSHSQFGVPSFNPSKTQSSSSSKSSTIWKSALTFDDHGPIQHENSEEDVPDFKARTVTSEVKLVQDYTGTDCDDIRHKHTSGAKSGIFKIRPKGSNKVLSVYCDQDTSLGGWLIIHQREDGSVNFNRTWEDYKNGFGNIDTNGKGEVWLGNEYIHLLTQKDSILRVELEDWSGEKVYAEYDFQLGSESEGYILKVSQYEGTAGDALIEGSKDDGEYTSHVNMKFSTFDRDSDKWEENCAEMYGGGWWYNNCQAANLNGIYYSGGQYDPRNNVPYEIENGLVWAPFKAVDYSLKIVKMKIRPVDMAN
ncbi:fibrinogen alpha chain [Bombina bombina]|nr:fibrinogen alpha chain [Bombina bombina]